MRKIIFCFLKQTKYPTPVTVGPGPTAVINAPISVPIIMLRRINRPLRSLIVLTPFLRLWYK